MSSLAGVLVAASVGCDRGPGARASGDGGNVTIAAAEEGGDLHGDGPERAERWTGGHQGGGSEHGGAGGSGGEQGGAAGSAGLDGDGCDPALCPAPASECQEAVCLRNGQCAIWPLPDGTLAGTQIAGDCRRNVCKAGALVGHDDPTDPPDDDNECTHDMCGPGGPSHAAMPIDLPCGEGQSSVCDGSGTCVECTSPEHCPGPDTECQFRTCDAGVCGVTFAPRGRALLAQTAGDCQKSQCDGGGSVEAVADPADVEDDGNACTNDFCLGGAVAHLLAAPATACDGGLRCDGAGRCVACLSAADCQAPANPCLEATCVAGSCGAGPRPEGAECDDGNACTLLDTCQSGACAGSDPVLCLALDQCHVVGICDPATGACSEPAKADGSACNDGDACTLTDSCQSGVCEGVTPVVCTAGDPCHEPGTCDPTTGVCSAPERADGAACDDGNPCTQTDSCRAGACEGSSPVVCVARDQCHDAGTCDPATGACSAPERADGAACDDGNPCSVADVCLAGVCSAGAVAACAPLDSCHVAGVCDPATGGCSHPEKPEGAACDDQNPCTRVDTCQAGKCTGRDVMVCVAADPCREAGECDPATGACTSPSVADGTACAVDGESGACQKGECGVCGNGTPEAQEECDDGNSAPCDGCSPDCELDTSITSSAGPGLALVIPDHGYRGSLTSMACAEVDVPARGDQRVEYVCPTVGITHSWVGDLTVKLVSPSGTVVTLMSLPGISEAADKGHSNTGDSSNVDSAYPISWQDGGPTSAELLGRTLEGGEVVCKDDGACLLDPSHGAAAPGNLARFAGEIAPGAWRLCVGDSRAGDAGLVDQVRLVIGQ